MMRSSMLIISIGSSMAKFAMPPPAASCANFSKAHLSNLLRQTELISPMK
jgi:hypothetical protein